jgi:hypothetical protein
LTSLVLMRLRFSGRGIRQTPCQRVIHLVLDADGQHAFGVDPTAVAVFIQGLTLTAMERSTPS